MHAVEGKILRTVCSVRVQSGKNLSAHDIARSDAVADGDIILAGQARADPGGHAVRRERNST